MATVTLLSAFDTDNFWSASANFISNDGTTYRYESAAGDFIEVTGTGLTDSSGDADRRHLHPDQRLYRQYVHHAGRDL